jgi:cholesterol transport system auxiliary component
VRPVLVTLAAVAASALLAGCVSLVPKAEPAQLYTLGAAGEGGAAADTVPSGPSRVSLSLGRVEFAPAAAGDRLLTVDGNQAAYISGARWVSPAEELFRQSLMRAYGGQAQKVRLVDRRAAGVASLLLDLRVDSFETRYDHGSNAAPLVVVEVSARMVRYPDRAVVSERSFRSEQRAKANRVGAIVPAYDAALDAVLGEMVSWSESAAGGPVR